MGRGQRFVREVQPMPVLAFSPTRADRPALLMGRGARFAAGPVIGARAPRHVVGRGAAGRVVTYAMKGEAPPAWQGMKALLHVTLPPLGPHSPAFHFAPLVALLEGVVELNRCHIRQSINRAEAGIVEADGAPALPLPPLYAAGIPYREDPFGEENWGDILYCLQCGWADCDRLVLWRVAEIREAGVPAARPVIKWQHLTYEQAVSVGYPPNEVDRKGVWLIHCCVEWPAFYSAPPISGHPLVAAWQKLVLVRPDPADPIEDPSKELGMGGSYTSAV